MMLYNKIVETLKNPWKLFYLAAAKGHFTRMPDSQYLKYMFRARTGRKLDLDSPQTFNEKLQWLKLYDRKPEYTMMVDKYRVRDHIADKLGEEYLIPLLGVWDDPDEIDFDLLPNQFVLKCNHNSGLGMCICKDKTKLDIPKVKDNLRRGLEQDYYITEREWPYKNIQRKIICEKFIEANYSTDSEITGLLDYKFYCFNGEPRFLYVGYADVRDGVKHDRMTYLDLDWHKTTFRRPDHDELSLCPGKPGNFDEMIAVAKKLSDGIPFVRIDLYNINNRVYFSEMTFFPGSGFSPFSPEEAETILGSWIELPKIEN